MSRISPICPLWRGRGVCSRARQLLQRSDGRSARRCAQGKDLLRRVWHVTKATWIRGGVILWISLGCSLAGGAWLLTGDSAEVQTHGMVRTFLATGALTGWLALMAEGFLPFKEKSIFVNIIVTVLKTDVLQFGAIFVPLIIGFTTAINSLLYFYPEWASRWGSWWLVLEKLLLLSFIQEPPEIYEGSPGPSSLSFLLGTFQEPSVDSVLPLIMFLIFYVFYVLVSVILLVNLLIAMMTARYEKNKENATIVTRVAFGRVILRFERFVSTVRGTHAAPPAAVAEGGSKGKMANPQQQPKSLQRVSTYTFRSVRLASDYWSRAENTNNLFDEEEDGEGSVEFAVRRMEKTLAAVHTELGEQRKQLKYLQGRSLASTRHAEEDMSAMDGAKQDALRESRELLRELLEREQLQRTDHAVRLERAASKVLLSASGSWVPRPGRFSSHADWPVAQPFVSYAVPSTTSSWYPTTVAVPYRDRPSALTAELVFDFLCEAFSKREAMQMQYDALESLARDLDEPRRTASVSEIRSSLFSWVHFEPKSGTPADSQVTVGARKRGDSCTVEEASHDPVQGSTGRSRSSSRGLSLVANMASSMARRRSASSRSDGTGTSTSGSGLLPSIDHGREHRALSVMSGGGLVASNV